VCSSDLDPPVEGKGLPRDRGAPKPYPCQQGER